jgi:flagellar motor protein MotB
MLKKELSIVSDNGSGEDLVLAPLMASLSLLLIAFFILFYSMTMIDESKKNIAVGSLQGSFGYLDGGREGRATPKATAPFLETSLIRERARDLQERLRGYLRRRGIKPGGLEVAATGRGLTVKLVHRLVFTPGRAQLNPTGRALLLKLARLFKSLPQVVFELQDLTLRPGGPGPVPLTPISLAAVRAARCYRFLVHKGGVAAENIQAFGRTAAAVKGLQGALLIRISGGVPAVDAQGRPRKIKIGDFTF